LYYCWLNKSKRFGYSAFNQLYCTFLKGHLHLNSFKAISRVLFFLLSFALAADVVIPLTSASDDVCGTLLSMPSDMEDIETDTEKEIDDEVDEYLFSIFINRGARNKKEFLSDLFLFNLVQSYFYSIITPPPELVS